MSPYENYSKKELILRDQLAIDRTILANERSLLAYIRTALALVVVGATVWHFIGELVAYILGGFLILLGLGMLAIGIKRYLKMRNQINVLRNK